MFTRFVSVLAVLSVTARMSAAQAVVSTGAASIVGSVRDTGVVRYTRTFMVCTVIRTKVPTYSMPCARVDTAGSYRLDSLPLTGLRFSVQCSTRVGVGKIVASDSIVLSDTALVRRDWIVSSAGCDLRPVRRVTGVFRGHYTPGFESSEFVPCAADAWFIPTDSLDSYPYDAKRAWATWRAAADQKLNWPKAPRDAYGNPTYYVRWRGTVVGPGNYGHMGVSPFEFLVDSVFELRAARKSDCH